MQRDLHPPRVSDRLEILDNAIYLRESLALDPLNRSDEETLRYARSLLVRGRDFVLCLPEHESGEILLSPSRFSGYPLNEFNRHLTERRNGGATNQVLSRVLGPVRAPDDFFWKHYRAYCLKYRALKRDGKVSAAVKGYWTLPYTRAEEQHVYHELFRREANPSNLAAEPKPRYELPADPDDFLEGAVRLRSHLERERDPRVIRLAKERFLKKHGRLFCEVCGYDFERHFGPAGRNIIDGHHVEPIGERASEGSETRPEDIVLLCPNCHRMVHSLDPMPGITTLRALRQSAFDDD